MGKNNVCHVHEKTGRVPLSLNFIIGYLYVLISIMHGDNKVNLLYQIGLPFAAPAGSRIKSEQPLIVP